MSTTNYCKCLKCKKVFDMDKMNAVMQDPEVQKKKDTHTVIDPLIISMPV